MQYFVHPDNTSTFTISADGVLITTANQFDFESDPNELVVIVIARDNGSPQLSSDTRVEITLLDVNEFSPVFVLNSTLIAVREDVVPFTTVLTVVARDDDGGSAGVVEYALVSSGLASPFSIDNTTGAIVTTASLDREMADSYTVQVQAFNPLASPSRATAISLTFQILDFNDNAPTFTQSDFAVAVTTNLDIGDTILTVSARDADIGSNGAIRYSLANANSLFSISTSTGTITLASELRTTGIETLMVIATDQGETPLSSTATVTINIIQPLEIEFSQEGAGFILDQGSTTVQRFGFFVDSASGANGTISATLGNVTATAAYTTSLPEAVTVRGVVLTDEVWYDDPEVSVVVQVSSDIGDVHCLPTPVVITLIPDTVLSSLANLNVQVSGAQ